VVEHFGGPPILIPAGHPTQKWWETPEETTGGNLERRNQKQARRPKKREKARMRQSLGKEQGQKRPNVSKAKKNKKRRKRHKTN